jgi:hypothetical protein
MLDKNAVTHVEQHIYWKTSANGAVKLSTDITLWTTLGRAVAEASLGLV